MYPHNQPRPGYQHQQQGWGARHQQQQDVRILSSSGFGVRGGMGVQNRVGVQNGVAGGMFRSGQQGSFPSQISAAGQPRGMSEHYQGNVVIAGGQQVVRGVGQLQGVVSGGVYRSGGQVYGAGLQGVSSSRSQSLSSGSVGQHGQKYSQQHRQAYQPTPVPLHEQFIPGQQHVQSNHHQQRSGQVFTPSSFQQVSSPYRQVQPSNSYTHMATPPPPPVSLPATTPASQAAAPENPFLSAFEKSFESFLNSKYSDDAKNSTVVTTEPHPDPNSVENISSILNDFSKSNSPSFQSNPLNFSKSPSFHPAPSNAPNRRSNNSRQQTLPRNNTYSQPKPQYNPVQEAKTPTLPKSLMIIPKSNPSAPKPMQFVTKPMTFVQSKPIQNKYSAAQTNSTVIPSSQTNKMTSQSQSLSLPAKNSPSRPSTGLLPSYQSPQGGIQPSSNISLIKVSNKIETVVIDEPEEKPVVAESKPVAVKADPDRKFQCNSCPKAFKSSSHLKEHEITHTGNYPFNCETCKKGFKRENTLNTHKCLVKDEKVRPFKCEGCSKGYASKKTLLEHKCASNTEGNSIKKEEHCEEEELIGDIIESVEVEVPVFVKSSGIVFSNIANIAMIIGDLIEYEDFDSNLEEAVMDGWEVEVIGDDNIIWDDNVVPVDDFHSIPDGIEEMAKGAGLAVDDVRDTLEFFINGTDGKVENQTFRLPWQKILSVHEEHEKTKIEAKAKEELLLGDQKNSSVSDTLEELSVDKDTFEPKAINTSLNKFTYFNDELETTIAGGSGEDSDDEWTVSKNKCKLCKKKFSSKWHLKKHAQVHTDRKGTYKCIPCKRSFKRKDLREKHRCDGVFSGSMDKSYNSTLNDVEMSSDEETLDEKADTLDITPKRQSMLLHSTLM